MGDGGATAEYRGTRVRACLPALPNECTSWSTHVYGTRVRTMVRTRVLVDTTTVNVYVHLYVRVYELVHVCTHRYEWWYSCARSWFRVGASLGLVLDYASWYLHKQ
jgi:hypothetical protein